MDILSQNEIENLKKTLSLKGLRIEGLDVARFLKKKESDRRKIFTEFTFKADEIEIPLKRIKEIIELKVLDYTSESRGEISVTAKGVIILKYNLVNISDNIDNMLDDINSAFYEDFLRKAKIPLKFEEKCAIITLLGLLSFTKNYSINITTLREREDLAINKCLGMVSVFLSSILKVENTLNDKLKGNGTEGKAAVTFFRRLDDIQLKTDSIYVKLGGSHYLDIISGKGLDKDKLSYLLRRIFNEKPLNFEERIALVSLLKEIDQERIVILGISPDFDSIDIKSELTYNMKDYES